MNISPDLLFDPCLTSKPCSLTFLMVDYACTMFSPIKFQRNFSMTIALNNLRQHSATRESLSLEVSGRSYAKRNMWTS